MPGSSRSAGDGPRRLAGDGVEADGRLVEHQQARPVHQRLRQLEPADHAARVRRRQAIGRHRRAPCAAPRRCARVAFALGHVEEPGEQPTFSQPVSCRVDRELLGHVAEQPAHLHRRPATSSRTPRPALAGPQQGGDHPDRRGLARAVGTEEPEHLARLDCEVTPSTARTSSNAYRRSTAPTAATSSPCRIGSAVMEDRSCLTDQFGKAAQRGECRLDGTSVLRVQFGHGALNDLTTAIPAIGDASPRGRCELEPRGSRVVGVGRRERSPASTRRPTSVLTVLGTRPSASAASPTRVPGRREAARRARPRNPSEAGTTDRRWTRRRTPRRRRRTTSINSPWHVA